MASFESGTVIRLASREAITLPDIRGATLRVKSGTLWLTQEHDRGDVVLRAGDNFVVESDGKTVVEAQDDATFAVTGRAGAKLQLPAHARRAGALWTALVALLTPAPGYRAPYA